MNREKMVRRYNFLDLFLIPVSIHVSIKWWKKLCHEKHELAHQLGIY